MISIQEYQRLIQEVADLERREAEAQGAIANMKQGLLKDFGVKTITEARQLREQWTEELAQAEKEAEAAHTEYLKRYSELHKKA